MDIVFVYNSNIVDSVRKLNTIKYQFRSISKYAPDIDNIFFVVKDKAEFENVYTNITFIEYKDIVPDYILESTDAIDIIDLYITNIPNLNDKFLYIRENWFLLKTTKFFFEEFPLMDFFTEQFNENIQYPSGTWGSYMYTLTQLFLENKIGEDIYNHTNSDNYIIPFVSLAPIPIIKQKFDNYIQDLKSKIENDIEYRTFILRKYDNNPINNLNYFLYTYHTYYLSDYIPESFHTVKIKMNISNNLINDKLNAINVNDKFLTLTKIDKIKTLEEFEEKKALINNWLEQWFPDKCKYEI